VALVVSWYRTPPSSLRDAESSDAHPLRNVVIPTPDAACASQPRPQHAACRRHVTVRGHVKEAAQQAVALARLDRVQLPNSFRPGICGLPVSSQHMITTLQLFQSHWKAFLTPHTSHPKVTADPRNTRVDLMAEIAGIVIGAVGLAALESSVCSTGLLQLQCTSHRHLGRRVLPKSCYLERLWQGPQTLLSQTQRGRCRVRKMA
jgi:hypothetical protein